MIEHLKYQLATKLAKVIFAIDVTEKYLSCSVKSFHYVENECKKIIDQLVEKYL